MARLQSTLGALYQAAVDAAIGSCLAYPPAIQKSLRQMTCNGGDLRVAISLGSGRVSIIAIGSSGEKRLVHAATVEPDDEDS